MLKRIARKILRAEIEEYEIKIRDLKQKANDLIDEKRSQAQNHLQQTMENYDEKLKLSEENKKLKDENEILRKYYDLDKEPSDEIKMKIHIDLELNRVKEENLKLIAMIKQQIQYIPQPNPIYSPFGRF